MIIISCTCINENALYTRYIYESYDIYSFFFFVCVYVCFCVNFSLLDYLFFLNDHDLVLTDGNFRWLGTQKLGGS